MDLSNVKPDILRQSVMYLYPEEIIKACTANRFFNDALCQNEYFWRDLYRRDFSSYLVHKNYKQAYIEAYTGLKNAQYWNNYAAEKGFDKSLKEPINKNAIMMNAAYGGQEKIVKMMLNLGANNYNGTMAWASEAGHEDIVRLMLKHGANDYNAAMGYAALGGHEEIVKLMLSLGANNYNHAMIDAKRGGHEAIVKLLKRYL